MKCCCHQCFGFRKRETKQKAGTSGICWDVMWEFRLCNSSHAGCQDAEMLTCDGRIDNCGRCNWLHDYKLEFQHCTNISHGWGYSGGTTAGRNKSQPQFVLLLIDWKNTKKRETKWKLKYLFSVMTEWLWQVDHKSSHAVVFILPIHLWKKRPTPFKSLYCQLNIRVKLCSALWLNNESVRAEQFMQRRKLWYLSTFGSNFPMGLGKPSLGSTAPRQTEMCCWQWLNTQLIHKAPGP